MPITFKLYATLQDYLPVEARKQNALQVEIDEATTIQQLIDRHNLPAKSCHLVLVDGHFVPPEARASRILKNGETVAIWPPIAGG